MSRRCRGSEKGPIVCVCVCVCIWEKKQCERALKLEKTKRNTLGRQIYEQRKGEIKRTLILPKQFRLLGTNGSKTSNVPSHRYFCFGTWLELRSGMGARRLVGEGRTAPWGALLPGLPIRQKCGGFGQWRTNQLFIFSFIPN